MTFRFSSQFYRMHSVQSTESTGWLTQRGCLQVDSAHRQRDRTLFLLSSLNLIAYARLSHSVVLSSDVYHRINLYKVTRDLEARLITQIFCFFSYRQCCKIVIRQSIFTLFFKNCKLAHVQISTVYFGFTLR